MTYIEDMARKLKKFPDRTVKVQFLVFRFPLFFLENIRRGLSISCCPALQKSFEIVSVLFAR